ncbi:MAG TPA: hypothetical protein VHP37_13635 [Burkholderiales bacterium]|nr:hypothetical protein [Burkholderiales bacterium]
MRLVWVGACALGLGIATNVAHAQHYPAKPVRIVTVAPGSANDIVARLVADELKTPFAQPVIVAEVQQWSKLGSGPHFSEMWT